LAMRRLELSSFDAKGKIYVIITFTSNSNHLQKSANYLVIKLYGRLHVAPHHGE
jgi:hypothetical protein